MKLVEMKCKNCGANLRVNSDVKETYCQFCSAKFKIDDEVQHVKYDNMEQSGYEFEKGRIRAQQENQFNNQVYYSNVQQTNQYNRPIYYQKKSNNKT